MKAKEFDAKFESGADISDQLDLEKAVRVNQAVKRVNVDFPVWMVEALDKQAKRLGITRQSLLKVYIAASLKEHGGIPMP